MGIFAMFLGEILGFMLLTKKGSPRETNIVYQLSAAT